MKDFFSNINELKKMFEIDKKRNQFQKYIEYIRFPFFKNFKEGLKVNFTYPITFLIGPNGTGKSSLLNALYGAPEYKNVSDFWFTTALDPIKDLENHRHCFIYSFYTYKTKTLVEVLKTRIQKQNNPDYWEPSRPLKQYKMKKPPVGTDKSEAVKTRWKLLKRNVNYLDFRYDISAYDKYFYFGEKPNTKTMKTKQDKIRRYAPKLRDAYDQNKTITHHSRKALTPVKLTDEEIKIISEILGKKYSEARILKHDFYDGKEGFSVKYNTNSNIYSEAFAGSGETSIVKMVHDICNTEDYSLVLLDEPETSLHPMAQKNLVNFLLEKTKQKKLQMIISTHSPNIIEGMPKESIKVLREENQSGKVEIIEDMMPEQAFYYIGQSQKESKVIVTEDILSKMILDKVIEKMGGDSLKAIFDIQYFPGGVSRIKQDYMTVYSKEVDTIDHFVIFDGDQSREKIDIGNLADNEKINTNLKLKVTDIVDQDIEFNTDSGSKREEQLVKMRLDYIKYHHDKVFFLPKSAPEEIIWSEDFLNRTDFNDKDKQTIRNETILKKKLNLFSKCMFGNDTAEYQQKVYDYLLIRWLESANSDYNEIKKILEKIRDMNS